MRSEQMIKADKFMHFFEPIVGDWRGAIAWIGKFIQRTKNLNKQKRYWRAFYFYLFASAHELGCTSRGMLADYLRRVLCIK